MLSRLLVSGFFLLSGCAMNQVGIRPTEPPLAFTTSDPCGDYLHYANYVQDLQESYAARATGNRLGAYAAGGIAVSGTAGSAGLAAEGASSVASMGLISIAQAALGTLFNVVDNPTLAAIYTIASNGLAVSLDDSFATMTDASNPHACLQALVQLRHTVTTARNNLELARTDAASAALQRALAQTQHYTAIVSQFPTIQPITSPSTLDATLNRIDERLQILEQKGN